MNQPADMFGMALADIANRITSQALKADPVLSAKLHNLQGKTVELQCTLPPAIWHIQIDGGSLRTLAGPAASPNAVVRGTLIELSGWLLPGSNDSAADISGDRTLLLELTDILKSFSPDPTTGLQGLFGEELASTLVGGAEAGLQALQSLLRGALDTAGAQAKRQFGQQGQLKSFLDGVDALRERVDQLAAGISAAETSRRHAHTNRSDREY